MLLSQILEGRHVIAMENPTYKQAYRVFQSLGYEVCPVEMDANGMEPELLLNAGANVAYVSHLISSRRESLCRSGGDRSS